MTLLLAPPVAAATKTLRLGGRVVTIAGPADDEYWGSLEDGGDEAFWQICRRYVRPRDVCFDIGANLGMTSLLLAQVEGRPAVHAFEPGPHIFEDLCCNLAANRATNVVPVNAAIGSAAGRARFLEASAYGHLSEKGAVEVDVLTVPGYMASRGIPRLDFCKLDIEGSERRVLRSALPIFERDRTIVFFEFNSWCQLAYGNTNPKDFIDWICATFPAVFSVHPQGTRRVTSPLQFLQTNLVHHGCVDDLLVSFDSERLGDAASDS
jgi:FkbM family methyltransferase